MLTPKPIRQSKRRGKASARLLRRTEKATRVPVSKKCKLDIKRKHLRAVLPGCFSANSYPVNIQLQIDGEALPGLYKCTIKRHINNKTNCVNYRLQGTGIYEHLRGLYMRGFCFGEDPSVMILVASRQESTDLDYSLNLDDDSAGCAVDAPTADGATDSEFEWPQRHRQLRPSRQRPPPQQMPLQRKEYPECSLELEAGEDEDFNMKNVGGEEGEEGEEEEEEEEEPPVAGPSGRRRGYIQDLGQTAAPSAIQFQHHLDHARHQFLDLQGGEMAHRLLQAHPLYPHGHNYHLFWSQLLQAYKGGGPYAVYADGSGVAYPPALYALADDSAALMFDETLDSSHTDDAADDPEADSAEADWDAWQAGCGPGPSLYPFYPLALGPGAMELMGFGGFDCLGTGSSHLLGNTPFGQPSYVLVPDLQGPYIALALPNAAYAQMPFGVLPKHNPLHDPRLSPPPLTSRQLQALTGRSSSPRAGAANPRAPISANGAFREQRLRHAPS